VTAGSLKFAELLTHDVAKPWRLTLHNRQTAFEGRELRVYVAKTEQQQDGKICVIRTTRICNLYQILLQ